MENTNKIVEIFTKLKTYNESMKEPFKARAYATAIKNIKSVEIRTMDDVYKIDGIGRKIEHKIREILETGKLQEYEDLMQDSDEMAKMKSLEELTSVHGIGNVKAQELMDKGISSIEELTEAVQKATISLNDKQLIGLHYYEHIKKKIPRKELENHEQYFQKLSKELNFEFLITGSYRRGAKESGDIDLLIINESDITIDKIIDRLMKDDYVPEDGVLARGDKKFMGMAKLPKYKTFRRLDILIIPRKQYPFAALYFTGSMEFNIVVRRRALEMGYTINEYSLSPLKTTSETQRMLLQGTTFTSENDVLAFLDIPWHEPHERNKDKIKKF